MFGRLESLALSLNCARRDWPPPTHTHPDPTCPDPTYAEDPAMISMLSSGRGRAVSADRRLGEELGLHRSNRLPWKRIFLESSLRVSQMEPTSSWQSDSAVRAHVWKASQWLRQTKHHRIKTALCHFKIYSIYHADMHWAIVD